MKNFINIKDIPAKNLKKILTDAKKRKKLRKKLSTLEVDRVFAVAAMLSAPWLCCG